jgi:hypothetical protein
LKSLSWQFSLPDLRIFASPSMRPLIQVQSTAG